MRFAREAFSSPVDQIIVVHLTADKPGQISFIAEIFGGKNTQEVGDEYFTVSGVKPNGLVLKGKSSTYLGIEGRVKYVTGVKAVAQGGKMTLQEESLTVKGADEVTLPIAAATNFINYKDISADPEARVKKYLFDIKDKSYDQLRRDHIVEH